MSRSKHEPDAHFGNAAGNLCGRKCYSNTRSFQHISCTTLTGRLAIAMFGDARPGGSSDDSRSGRDVEEFFTTATCAAGVNKVGDVHLNLGRQGAHGGDRPGNFLGCFTFHAQPHQQRADLR